MDQLADERQWAAIDYQAMELKKLRDEKLSVLVIQQQTELIKDWADRYLTNPATGLRVLETDLDNLSEQEREELYHILGADKNRAGFA